MGSRSNFSTSSMGKHKDIRNNEALGVCEVGVDVEGHVTLGDHEIAIGRALELQEEKSY